MFDELRKEIGGMFGEMRHGTRLRTITVAKPYCAPARHLITATFKRYGVKLYGYDEQVRMLNPLRALRRMNVESREYNKLQQMLQPLPMAQIAKVTVSEQAAAWAEYLLLRTGKLYCPDGYVNKRNAAWARKHGGQMPPAWAEGKPWIEKGCSEGRQAWAPLLEAAKKKGKK